MTSLPEGKSLEEMIADAIEEDKKKKEEELLPGRNKEKMKQCVCEVAIILSKMAQKAAGAVFTQDQVREAIKNELSKEYTSVDFGDAFFDDNNSGIGPHHTKIGSVWVEVENVSLGNDVFIKVYEESE